MADSLGRFLPIEFNSQCFGKTLVKQEWGLAAAHLTLILLALLGSVNDRSISAEKLMAMWIDLLEARLNCTTILVEGNSGLCNSVCIRFMWHFMEDRGPVGQASSSRSILSFKHDHCGAKNLMLFFWVMQLVCVNFAMSAQLVPCTCFHSLMRH